MEKYIGTCRLLLCCTNPCQSTRRQSRSERGWHASSILLQAGIMLPQRAAAAVRRAAFGAHLRTKGIKGQGTGCSHLHNSWRGRCAPPRSRSSFASAQLGAASPTATGRTLLSQRRAAVARPSSIVRSSSRKGRNSLCGLLELQDPQCTIGPPTVTHGCTPCLGKSDNKHLEKFCPGSPFEPSFSPRRGLLLCSTIR